MTKTNRDVGRGSRRVLRGVLAFAAICGVIVAITHGGPPGAGSGSAAAPASQTGSGGAAEKLDGLSPSARKLVQRALESMASTRRAVAALEFCRDYTKMKQSLQDAQLSLDQMISKLRNGKDAPSTAARNPVAPDPAAPNAQPSTRRQ